jgi:hypothetical protein
VSSFAGIDTPTNKGLVLEDTGPLESYPVAAERSVVCVVFNRHGGRELLEALDEGSVTLNIVFVELQ